MIIIDIENESNENNYKVFLNEDEAIEESVKKECIVAYY